jgi:hypothetical protein
MAHGKNITALYELRLVLCLQAVLLSDEAFRCDPKLRSGALGDFELLYSLNARRARQFKEQDERFK